MTGSWLSMESVGAMLCDGVLEVLITRDGAPLALRSAQARFLTPKQRQALAAIYPHCAVPGCPVPAIAGHAHHIVPVSEGGETCVENGIILCTFHHNQLHAGHYRIVPNPQLARRGSGQEPLPGVVVVPTSSGGHGVNRTARPHAPTQSPGPVNLVDRIAWKTTNSDDSSDGGWATPGVDARTIAGWGQDSPALQASQRAWVQPGVRPATRNDGEQPSTAEPGADEEPAPAPPAPRWGQTDPTSSGNAPRPTTESMTTGRRYELRAAPEPTPTRTHGPVDYIDMGDPAPQIAFVV